jgi:hypothetical protein
MVTKGITKVLKQHLFPKRVITKQKNLSCSLFSQCDSYKLSSLSVTEDFFHITFLVCGIFCSAVNPLHCIASNNRKICE